VGILERRGGLVRAAGLEGREVRPERHHRHHDQPQPVGGIRRRRAFLTTLAAGPVASRALAAAAGAPIAPADDWREAFHSALAGAPWLLAFEGTQAEFLAGDATVSGRLPAELEGTFYRNGPARQEIGGFRYHHWFDGDGMLQAWRIGGGGVRHQARMIATRKYLAEKDAGRALYPGFGTLPPDPAPVTSPDLVNSANISVLHHAGRLLALWEAGSPWLMDPASLETEGIYSFSEQTRGVPFSAHPRVEADGTLWNFGYVSAAGLLVLWHIDADGRLVKAGTVACQPMSMPHDFLVTERHIVILVSPFEFTPGSAGTFLDAHVWHPEHPTRVAVIDKNEGSSVCGTQSRCHGIGSL
jgi:carotenoid cleavage dioxygenase